jgi:hypothetical protein
MRNFKNEEFSVVVHTCNPSYSRSRSQEDCNSRSALAKINETPFQLGMVVYACNSNYTGSVNGRIVIQVSPAKSEPLF